MITREPVVLPLSVLAGLSFLFAGVGGITALSGYPIVAATAACGALGVASAQVGIQFWIRGQVSPVAQLEQASGQPEPDPLPEQPGDPVPRFAAADEPDPVSTLSGETY